MQFVLFSSNWEVNCWEVHLLKDFDEETNLCKEWRDDDPKGKVIQSDGLLFTRKAVLAGAFMSLEEVYAAVKVRRNLR